MIRVVLGKTLEDYWMGKDEENKLTDEEIIELVKEDLISFLDGAEFKVIRYE